MNTINIPTNYLLHENTTLRAVRTELSSEGADGGDITTVIDYELVCPAKAAVLEAVFAHRSADSYVVCEFGYGSTTSTLKIPLHKLVPGSSKLAAHLIGAGFVWAANKSVVERFRGYLLDSLLHIQNTWARDLTNHE